MKFHIKVFFATVIGLMAASRKVAAAENDQGLGEIGILGNKIASIFQNRSNQQSKTFPRLQNLNDYDRQQWWEKRKKAEQSGLFYSHGNLHQPS